MITFQSKRRAMTSEFWNAPSCRRGSFRTVSIDLASDCIDNGSKSIPDLESIISGRAATFDATTGIPQARDSRLKIEKLSYLEGTIAIFEELIISGISSCGTTPKKVTFPLTVFGILPRRSFRSFGQKLPAIATL